MENIFVLEILLAYSLLASEMRNLLNTYPCSGMILFVMIRNRNACLCLETNAVHVFGLFRDNSVCYD